MVSLAEFDELIPTSLLEALSLEYKVDAPNQIKLPGRAVFLCILNGLVNHPELTQRILEEEYARQTGGTCDHSTFGKRMAKIDPGFFRAILDRVHAGIGPKITAGDKNALRLRIADSTTVTLSAKLLSFGIKVRYQGGKEYRHVKSVVEISDQGLPDILHICKDDSELADSIAMGNAIVKANRKGDLWIFDRGMSHRGRMLDLHQAGSFFITPYNGQLHKVTDVVMRAESEDPPVKAPGPKDSDCVIHRVEQVYLLDKSRPHIPGLESMQLVIIHCHRYDTRKKQWVPLVIMTNLPLSECRSKLGPYTLEEVVELYRRRWDIEIFFRFLKQRLGYKHLVSRSENGIRVMIIMSMITALLLVWYKHRTGITRGWRSVIFWFAEDVREWTESAVRFMAVYQRE